MEAGTTGGGRGWARGGGGRGRGGPGCRTHDNIEKIGPDAAPTRHRGGNDAVPISYIYATTIP